MASISLGDNKIELADGSEIKDAAETLGIPFSCKDGVCGTCLIKVKEGKENLSAPNNKEKEFGLTDKSERLACQCKIKSGNVKIESAY
ncbi:MAG: (2Fe-2S)-binding protein [archaeon]|nr:(2Fe-2S)-binding protein [archaeon]MCR4323719.1 (2Fe-2S)-binding protein [Nanoarchaeota archaeon]